MKLRKENFSGLFSSILSATFLSQLDRMFGRVFDNSEYIPFVVRDFVDATTGAKARALPLITSEGLKDYFFVKTDASVNAIIITPSGTNTIEGATSLTLAAQYDKVHLIAYNGVWYIFQ